MNYFQNKVVAITGSSGFIGTKLVSALNQQGGDLKLLVRSKNPDIPYSQTKCDIANDEIPLDFFSEVNTVIHLAGSAHDTADRLHQDYYHKINVVATIQLAKIAVQCGVKNFVFISSVKAGDVEFKSFKNISKNNDFYAYTKRIAEIQLIEILKETAVHLSIIRPSLVYGPFVKGNLNSMLSGIKRGWFPPLPNILNKKSMVHVDDLVRAIIFVAEKNQTTGEIFNVTDGKQYSSREIYEVICGIVEKPIPSWSMPLLLFKTAARIHPKIKKKVDKLFLDTLYSSKKIEVLGYQAYKTLKDMNKSSY